MTDTAFDEFMTAGGYPEPSVQSGERKIWSASTRTILTSRICSASLTGKAATGVTSPEIRQIVERYLEYLGLPADSTKQQQEAFLEEQASRISRQVAELADQLGQSAVTDWVSRNGQPPDYETHRGLLNNARASAMEIVLSQELYEQIPEPENSEPTESATEQIDRRLVPWEQRWIHSELRSEPSETLEDLAETVWPDPEFSVMFRIKAGYLLAALAEEGLQLPHQVGDQRAMQLAPLVYDDLERDGLPRR